MKKEISKFFMFVVLTAAFSGCATAANLQTLVVQDPVKAVSQLISKEKVSDARYLRVKQREFLAFDMASQARLEDYRNLSSLADRQKFLTQALNDAKNLGDKATEIELKRVQADRINSITGENGYEQVLMLYKKKAAEDLAGEIHRVESLKNKKDSDRYAKNLKSHIEVSIKKRGRTFRQIVMLPLSPFVRAWMGYHVLSTPHAVAKVNFKEANFYRPEIQPAATNSPDVSTFSDNELLAYYAPVIAIEKKQDIKYDPKDDQFGGIVMEGETVEKAQPKVDVEHPAVYTYAETKMIQGTQVKVLVYTLWFPERPQLNGKFDPEVGTTQGSIIRITLGKSNQPLIYENVSSCGCFYKVFPSTVIEKLAQKNYTSPLAGKHFVIENKVAQKIDADVPSLVNLDPANPHLIAFYSAGTHDVIEIQPNAPEQFQANEKGVYKLVPYENLENLPFHNGTISMFNKDGLVRLADRIESKLLAASGIFHAGTPRQRGTLMIYFDQADFDDPHLLEKYLRIPDKAFSR